MIRYIMYFHWPASRAVVGAQSSLLLQSVGIHDEAPAARGSGRVAELHPPPHMPPLLSPPPHLLNLSIVSLGAEAHLAPVLERLRRRQPITIVGIGSSITSRIGGCTHDLSGRDCGTTSKRASGWLKQFFEHLNASFPSPRHRLFNAGIPASAPSAFVECLNWLTELGDVHLFVLEFVAAASIQDLVLRLLSRVGDDPSRSPAILFALFHRWISPMEAAHNRLMQTALGAGLPLVSQLRGLAPWRDIPWSEMVRTTTRGRLSKAKTKEGDEGVDGEAAWSPAAQCPDGLHPTTPRGQAFMGAALSLWLDRAWQRHHEAFLSSRGRQRPHKSSELTSSPGRRGHGATSLELREHRERAMRALGGGGTSSRRVTLKCFTLDPKRIVADPAPLREALEQATSDGRAARSALRHAHRRSHNQSALAMHSTSERAHYTWVSGLADALGPDSGAAPHFVSRHGFSFSLDLPDASPEGPRARTASPSSGARAQPLLALHDAKGGLSGVCPGDTAILNVSADVGDGKGNGRLARPYIALEYLSSWTGLGRAEVTCHRMCECKPAQIDAHVPAERASLRALHRIEISSPITSLEDCSLRLTILPTSSSGGHRFKLLRVSVGAHSQSEAHDPGWPSPPAPLPPPPLPICKSSGLKGDVAGPLRCEHFCRAANAPRHCMLCKCSSCPFCSGGRPADTRQHRPRDLQLAIQAREDAVTVPPPPPPPSPPPPMPGAGRFDASSNLFVCDVDAELTPESHQALHSTIGTCSYCRSKWRARHATPVLADAKQEQDPFTDQRRVKH